MASLWFTVFVIVLLAWRGRKQVADGWRQRRALPTGLYWSMAGLYALSGATFSFAAFGATHMRLPIPYATLQVVAMAGVVSWAMLLWIAHRLARPWLEAGDVPQAGRTQIHSVWGAFWPLGAGVGFLTLLLPPPA